MLSLEAFKFHGKTYFVDSCSDYLWKMAEEKLSSDSFFFPRWNSNAGFYGWVDTISAEFDISKPVADIWLKEVNHGIDCDWIVDNLSQEEIEFLASFGPFSNAYPANVKLWVERKRPISLAKWAYQNELYQLAKNTVEANLVSQIRRLTNLPVDQIVEKVGEDWNTIPMPVLLKRVYGFKSTKVAAKVSNYSEALVMVKLQNEINFSKWDGLWSIFSLIKAGVSASTVLSMFRDETHDMFAEEIVQQNLTARVTDGYLFIPTNISAAIEVLNRVEEPNKFNKKYWDGSSTVGSLLAAGIGQKDMLNAFVTIGNYPLSKKDISVCLVSVSHREITGRRKLITYSDIVPAAEGNTLSCYECQSLLIWAWAQKHVTWANKSKKVYGPAGHAVTLHNHTLISKITDDMLTSGVKTSPRVIEEFLEKEAEEEIIKSLGEYIELPRLKLKKQLPKSIRQITSTHGLREEGTNMNHCVGGYKDACLSKQSYIFHVEDGTELGATVEVSPNPWRVVQAMNYGNSHSNVAKQLVEKHIVSQLS